KICCRGFPFEVNLVNMRNKLTDVMKNSYVKTTLLALFVIFAAGCVFFNISDVDIGFHIKTGELIAKHGRIPTQNTFSFSMPEQPWALHQWAGTLAWYFVHLYGGYKGIIIFRVLVFLLTIGSLFLTLNLINKNYYVLKLILLTVFAVLVRHHFFERPLIFSALFLATLQYLVFYVKNRGNAKWFIFLIFIVWIQVHAGFIYGLLFLTAYFTGSIFDIYRRKPSSVDAFPQLFRILFFGIGGVIIGACLLNIVNPNGIKGILFAIDCLFDPLYHRIIAEYKTAHILIYKLFYITLFVTAALAVINRDKVRIGSVLVFLGFSILAIRTNRNILFYGIVVTPILFDLGIATIRKTAIRLPVMSRGLVKCAFLVALWAVLFVSVIIPDKVYCLGFGFYKPFYPSEIFDFIKKNKPRGNIFNDMQLGGPIIWFLYPDYRVFIDGRFEAYEKRFWIDDYYHILTTKKGWEDKLNKYNVTICFLSYSSGEQEDYIGKALQNSRSWRMVAFDDYTALFIKDSKENGDIISRYSYYYLRPLDDTLDFITLENADNVAMEARRAIAFAGPAIRARVFLRRASQLLSGIH
ncbi:MAG: hypothetical protein Q8R48_02095, partial [Candidatus Omnitrophota bacterium]|nr:hypothetical protein [Candidatus Omnitrophota bacterium]